MDYTVIFICIIPLLPWLWYYYRRPFEYHYSATEQQFIAAEERFNHYTPHMSAYPIGWFKLCDIREINEKIIIGRICLGLKLLIIKYNDDNDEHGYVCIDGTCPKCMVDWVIYKRNRQINIITNIMYDATDRIIQCSQCNYKHNIIMNDNRYITIQYHMLFMWYNNKNNNNKPLYELEPLADISNNHCYYVGTLTHHISCYITDIPENGADANHLNVVHKNIVIPYNRQNTEDIADTIYHHKSGLFHSWKATWRQRNIPYSHIADFVPVARFEVDIEIIKDLNIVWKPDCISIESNVVQMGLSVVHIHFNTPFGHIYIIETLLPISHTHQCAQNVLYADKCVPRWLCKMLLSVICQQFEKDLPIWNNKRCIQKPIIVKEDEAILRYRRFCKQFYPRQKKE